MTRMIASGNERLRMRAGQILGLLFLIGPVSDLADEASAARRPSAIAVALAGFVALYLVLLPPARRSRAAGGVRSRARSGRSRRSRC